ncbi:LysR family transcriptional regulator, partial [Mesorhizobium sp. M00.F.Ca.ET.149.01.1.1]
MNWDDVRIFLAVARAGQILGAAKRLELNHATVSRRIAALEEALRTKLFRRLTTGSELTPAGERFLDIAERMEGDMIAARSTIAGEGDDVSGTVRIGAPDGFGVAFLAKRLGELTVLHRELTIQLAPVPRSFSLSRREADIAITVERPTEGLPKAPADLGRHTLIGYVPDLIVSPSLDYAAEFSPDWRTSFAISSALGQAEAVRSGAGIGILHTFVARSMPELVPVDIVAPIR